LLPGTPRHILVATGTGSGKTESFLLPLLEHCSEQHSGGQTGPCHWGKITELEVNHTN
jgi:DEAD/DEAH box helicase domain-containing protein